MEPIVNEEPVIETPAIVTKPGENTDPALLLKSLQEEREKRRIAEAALLEARKAPEKSESEVFSEEGKFLDGKISTLQAQLAAREEQDRLRAVESVFPAIKDKQQEFETFRTAPENVGMKIETAAKAFLVENDLLEAPKVRKGLEKETGGVRVVTKTGRTPEEIDKLRIENYRQYVKELKAGTLNS